MAEATETSTAKKPVHRIKSGDVVVSVFPGARISAQRQYSTAKGVGFASSFRLEDISGLRVALSDAKEWCEHNAEEAAK